MLVGSIGGFLFGYDTGIIAGAQMFFKDDWPEIETHQVELIVSYALLGAFIGSIVAGPSADRFGRKPVIIFSDYLFTVGSVIMAYTKSIQMLMVGRILVGLGIGMASMVIPVYLSEVSPVKKRGMIVASFVMAITIGQLLSSIIALCLGHNWRLMLGLAAIPSLIQLVGMIYMPESQKWLLKNDKKQ